jgi:hypothetical protein
MWPSSRSIGWRRSSRGVPLARRALFLFLSAVALVANAASAQAAVPLHQRIDREIEKAPDFARQASPLASDAEFLRRIYLDLTGTIPTAVETRAFLADTTGVKRPQLIERLLASPEHARHMQEVFDAFLMERRPDRNVPRAEWQEYLRASFAANKHWDQLVREVLSADGLDPKLRPAAKFYLDRTGDPHVLTRDISRLFLGMNLQCAQCHDHPLVHSYKQEHYYGIYAFLNRSFLFTDAKRRVVLAENGVGEVSFQSVFDPTKLTRTTGPRVPDGMLVKEPAFPKGKEYQVAPAKGVRPIPHFSRRAQLAVQIVSKDNLRFRRNIANRLWALMMGRGLVQPLDFDHPENPPSHPQLLTLLADEMAATSLDMRHLLRELALSKTYQRSSELPAGIKEVAPESFAVANLKPLAPEQLGWSLMQATGLTDAYRKRLGKGLSERALYKGLAGNLPPIVATFGSSPGDPVSDSFLATLDQTLFVTNGALLRSWLAPQPGNLADRLKTLTTTDALADEIYLSVLTRLPTAEERSDIAAYLRSRAKDRPATLQEIAWALLASSEFRFNH